jgi:hypothetical protein
MYNKYLLFLAIALLFNIGYSQDSTENIQNLIENPIESVKKAEGVLVNHSLSNNKSEQELQTSDSLYQLGIEDAKQFHKSKNVFWTSYGISTIGGLLIGWPSSIGISNSEFPKHVIDYPNQARAESNSYKVGYEEEAEQKRKRKSRLGLILGSITNAVILINLTFIFGMYD